jgi:hypothetical protein
MGRSIRASQPAPFSKHDNVALFRRPSQTESAEQADLAHIDIGIAPISGAQRSSSQDLVCQIQRNPLISIRLKVGSLPETALIRQHFPRL